MLLVFILASLMVMYRCDFSSHVPNGQECWSSFHVLICHLGIFFGEMSLHMFCSFSSCIFECWILRLLYILDISHLPDVWFANIFSKSIFRLFRPLTKSFTQHKFLILMGLTYQCFLFICIVLKNLACWFGVCWNSWICGYIIVIMFIKFPANCFFIFSALLLMPFICILDAWYFPTGHWSPVYSCLAFLFSLCASFWIVPIAMPSN